MAQETQTGANLEVWDGEGDGSEVQKGGDICIESRKMVLKNLFSGKQWRNRHKEQTYGHGGEVRKG